MPGQLCGTYQNAVKKQEATDGPASMCKIGFYCALFTYPPKKNKKNNNNKKQTPTTTILYLG